MGSVDPGTPARLRRVATALPALAIVGVGVSTLQVATPRPVTVVRLHGGPTEGVSTWSFRVDVSSRLGDAERPVRGAAATVAVRWRGGAPKAAWSGALDAEGAAHVRVPADATDRGPVQVTVQLGGRTHPALDTQVSLTRDAWAAGATRRGGWVALRREGPWVLRVAPEHGVLAVPFADALRVEVGRGFRLVESPPPTADGATLGVLVPRPVPGRPEGFTLPVTPLSHTATVALEAREEPPISADGAPPAAGVAPGAPAPARGAPRARLEVALAVIPGALRATRDGDGPLVVESPILRDRAYVAVVSASERLLGATVPLAPRPDGTAAGELALPALPRGPLWAVVSSEPELRSAALVGWPLDPAASPGPPTTFDVPDVLLADGAIDAAARERTRVSRARWLTGGFAASCLALSAALLALDARRARARLEEHLARSGADAEATRQVAGTGGASAWLVVAAVLCLLVAASLAGLFAVAR